MKARWTDERIEVLRKRWMAGASASVIGNELGCTRNAVIGKAHRLGLERPAGQKLLDLKSNGCRWPVDTVDGQHLFCGMKWKGEHGPYCEGHMERAHVKAVKKPKEPKAATKKPRILDWLEAA